MGVWRLHGLWRHGLRRGLGRKVLTLAVVVGLGAVPALVLLLGREAATVGIGIGTGPGAAPVVAGRAPAETAATPQTHATAPRWAEVAWPFPTDQWGRGRAFRCGSAACGTEVTVYLRAKVGFCNCATGVSDDLELDRIADLEVFSDDWVALGEGRPVAVGAMSGRSRAYRIQMRYAAPVTAISVGFNDKCDVAVATVVADRDQLAVAERLALAFLNTDLVLEWAGREIGL